MSLVDVFVKLWYFIIKVIVGFVGVWEDWGYFISIVSLGGI